MSKSGIYLISAKHSDGDGLNYGIDRQISQSSQATSHYDKVDYGSTDGVDIKLSDSNTTGSTPFRGMGKEELLLHSSKPFWRRLRMICISFVLIGWLALLVTVVALVLIYPRCKNAESREWWQKDAIYRIYVRSFKDSNNDGIGDLNGIKENLGYLQDLGVGAISLSPIFEDDQSDNDFSVLTYMNVDNTYGGNAALDDLIQEAHSRGIKVILDFIPNHTSDKHNWFVESSKSPDRSNLYRNFYVWTDNPSNWKSVYNEGAWNMSSERTGEHFLHQFQSSQPDLNLRSTQVQDKLEEVIRYYLGNKSVDGLYIRDSAFLFEDFDMRNEVKISGAVGDDYKDYNHVFTYGLPEVHDMLARWRTLVQEYSGTSPRLIMADIKGSTSTMMSYYGHFQRDGVQLSLNMNFLKPEYAEPCDGTCINRYVDTWMDNIPAGRWPNWVLGDENSERLRSRYNESFIRAFTMLTMLLPGTPMIYYGDEIGMSDVSVTAPTAWSRTQIMRGLMQWENSTEAGFCPSCTSWIPAASNYQTVNVANQNGTDSSSLLNYFKSLMVLRQKDSFRVGDYHKAFANSHIFSFVREFDGEKGFLVAINFGSTSQTHDFTQNHVSIVKKATVEMTTGPNSGFSIEDEVDTDSLALGPHEGVVLWWDYVAKEL